MEYVYITENNLNNKQKYNYSQYGGNEFLDAYEKSRLDAISVIETENHAHETYVELKRIKDSVQECANINDSIKEKIDAYVKSFEVRKRLYSSYDQNWKPTSSEYNDYINYIILAEILVMACEKNRSMKYLSCLMKLDDTLISLIPIVPESVKRDLKEILDGELLLYQKCRNDMEEE